MGSTGMKSTLLYNDNDVTHGLACGKPNKMVLSPDSLKKDTWKPKTSLKWYDNPKNKNNIVIQ